MAERTSLAGRIGFLFVAILVVALAGVFASYAPSVPLARALRREAALDQVLAVAQAGGNVGQRIHALAPALGSSAVALAAGGDIAREVAAEKARVRKQFTAESAAVGWTSRLTIGIVTLLATGFGAFLLSLDRRRD